MDNIQTPTKFNNEGNANRQLLSIPPSPFLEKLGYGTGVNVWKLNHSPNSNAVRSPWAIKNIRKSINKQLSAKYQSLINKEAGILRSLNHENIIGFRGYLTSDDGRHCLAMEVGGESLGNMIEERYENNLGPFPSKIILKVALSIAKALRYLHDEKKILHGDLKSYNIVVKNNFEEIKLCDFGVSLDLDDENISAKYVGTPIYSAPECQKGSEVPITTKSDIFSLGLVMWEMISLVPPNVKEFMDDDFLNESDFNQSVIDSEASFLTQKTDSYSDSDSEENYGTRPPLPLNELSEDYQSVTAIFYACTEQNPDQRPSAAFLVDYLKILLKE